MPLSYEIMPKSGPMRRMVTLADVRTAMVYDLPPGTTKQPHWLNAGMLVVAASETGKQGDIRVATDALAMRSTSKAGCRRGAPPRRLDA